MRERVYIVAVPRAKLRSNRKSDFYEAIRIRRSVSSFKKDPLPDEVSNRVLEAARVPPSGSNRQPRKSILIQHNTLKRKTISLCNNQNFVGEAPVTIVACGQRLPINRGGYMGK